MGRRVAVLGGEICGPFSYACKAPIIELFEIMIPKTPQYLQVAIGRARLVTLQVTRAILLRLHLGHLYHLRISRLVEATGLFDETYYLSHSADVNAAGVNAALHYSTHGDAEGRPPLPLFDQTYYRSQLNDIAPSTNSLLHYSWVGRFQKTSPHPWFDIDYYLANNPDIAATGEDPLRHYWLRGGLEGRSPCPRFDGKQYCQMNRDVVSAGWNPLAHYLTHGITEGRKMHTGLRNTDSLVPLAASLPNEQQWGDASPHTATDESKLSIIIPVYKGRTETLRCIYSVLTSRCVTPFTLVVINDAGPDPELTADLHRLASEGLFTLIENSENLGFVKTVNIGMKMHPHHDVVLLNSDTEVFNDWLDRLYSVSARNPNVGTITPLSNNATICSYPLTLYDNPFALEISGPELDRLTFQVNVGMEVETPSAVGFCMFIRRQCLDEVGYFDENSFGKGYGEENDFSQRAIRVGWRNMITPEIYVRHWGSISFQDAKNERVTHALKMIEQRHPEYHRDVARHIQNDPLRKARQRLDWARLRRFCTEQNVLIVCHDRGGGTERHVQEDIVELERQGYGVFSLRPSHKTINGLNLRHERVVAIPNLDDLPPEREALANALRQLAITEIHTHSFVDMDEQVPQLLSDLARSLGIRLEVNVHDYEVICPRINLTDENGYYCGEPNEVGCNRCLRERGSAAGILDIEQWRNRYRNALDSARSITVPNSDVAARLQKHFPQRAFNVDPHDCVAPALQVTPPHVSDSEPLRIVALGAISKIKGYEVLLNCARNAKSRKLPLQFIVMGYSEDDSRLAAAGVEITGRYKEEDAAHTLAMLRPHAVWLPSIGPETYSYTLSLALQAGYPTFAFDIGAIANRLRSAIRAQHLAPLSQAKNPQKLNNDFVAFRASLATSVQ